ncbi:MAG: hypothetical protein AAFV43_11505 [Planctomycetota bacterium]
MASRRPLFALAVLVGAGLTVSVGCNSTVKRPSWLNPGNTSTQRYSAIVHDPYPLEDAGPEVVGGRPRGYRTSVPEVRRGQAFAPPRLVTPPR